MSQAGVGMVIEKLLTDESLRIRFALDRMETIAELCLRGFDLTRDEIDLFTGPMLVCGSWATQVSGGTAALRRPRVVRCALCGRHLGDKAMAIHVDSCAAQETIVVTTRSSVYELVVLRGDRGDVLVRGGRHFTEFTPVLFLGSIADDGSLEPHTIGIGLRMKFVCADRFVITSPVQSVLLPQRRCRRTGVCHHPVSRCSSATRTAH